MAKSAAAKPVRKRSSKKIAKDAEGRWKDPSRRGGVVSQIEGRLGIALPMAEGNAPVQRYINALPAWQKVLAKRVDSILTREVPQVRKAIKWHNPMYGVAGQGWFASVASFKNYLKVTFFRGTSLNPVPPGGQQKDMRWLDLSEDDDLDEKQLASWAKQASSLPGFWEST